MARNKTTFRLGLIVVAIGIAIMLYPLTSIVIHQMTAEAQLEEFLATEQPVEERQAQYAEAVQYNDTLDGTADGAIDPFEMEDYATASPLDVPEGDAFAYVSLPKLNVHLPVYLGASDYHLSLGAAHVEGTNLPVGGADTRAVIAAHRGYYNQPMFLNIDPMAPGDQIILYVLGETLVYEVYDREVIHPSEYGKLAVLPEEDILTLLTCTLDFVNPDRVLVNAVRVETPEWGEADNPEVQEVSDAQEDSEASVAEAPPVSTVESTPELGQNRPQVSEEALAVPEEIEALGTALNAETEGPGRSALVYTYGLMAITLLLWLALIAVVVRLVQSFTRNA